MNLSLNWLDLIKPSDVKVVSDEVVGIDNIRKTVFAIEPLERGYALTLGNALRRVLLSSLRGSAITKILIAGVAHEFSSISGVKEDVTEVVLNIKSLIVKLSNTDKATIRLRASKAGEVFAKDIDCGANVEIINKEQLICTLDKGTKIDIELTVENGSGYVAYNRNNANTNANLNTNASDGSNVSEIQSDAVGTIKIDAMFNPIRRVSYNVENSRVGQVTDYAKLIMDIETNGTVEPREAIALAARIIQDQMNVFINFEEEKVIEQVQEETPTFNKHLLTRIDELELSVRSHNCLKNDNIVYIGDLVTRSEMDMLRTPNFGRKSLNEIKDILVAMGLSFGMNLESWPPDNIEDLAKKYEEKY